MRQPSPSLPPQRRAGKIVVMFALMLPVIFAVTAVATEGGMLLDHRRSLQAAADSAATAGAIDLYKNYVTNNGTDPNNTAKNAAKAAATTHGFTTNATDTTVTVNVPPASGPSKDKPGFVEVIIKYKQKRYFSRLIGTEPVPLEARSVARGRLDAVQTGILILDLVQSESLKANGGGTMTVVGADVIVNSKDASAVGGDGTNTVLKVVDASFRLSGGVKSGTILQGNVLYNQKPTPDPLAYLPEPTAPAAVTTANKLNLNSAEATQYLSALGLNKNNVGQMYVLEPGRYTQMPNFGSTDVVILKQATANANKGIYYLDGSGFKSTGATVVMDPTGVTSGGLMFYNAPKTVNGGSDAMVLTGGRVSLAPLTSGIYKGMSIFQKRSSDIPIQITGQGSIHITGAFYAAGAALSITGSNSTGTDVIGSQYISRTLQTGGNGKYFVSWDANTVARLREVGLVE